MALSEETSGSDVQVTVTPHSFVSEKGRSKGDVIKMLAVGLLNKTYHMDGKVLFCRAANQVAWLFENDPDGDPVMADIVQWLQEQLDEEDFEKVQEGITVFMQSQVDTLPEKNLLALAAKVQKRLEKIESKKPKKAEPKTDAA